MPIHSSNDDEVLKLLGLSVPSPEPIPKAPAPATKQEVYPEEEDSEQEVSNTLAGQGSSDYKTVGFQDPVEMLFWIEPTLILHDWQIEDLMMLSSGEFSYEDRMKYCLTAANGSGKDAYILAPFAVWQITERIRSRFIGTSKSAHQINTQTNPYIKNLCVRYAKKLIEQGFHPKPFLYRTKPFHIVCNFTGAEILTFVTDEAENVEGYHPFPDAPKADLTIAINEAKGVGDEYFDGFSRCTYKKWLEVTSPGRMTGRNWEHYKDSIKRPEPREKGKFYSRRVTSYDCPHKSRTAIEEDAIQYGGKDSELFRSKHLAEYTSIGEQILLTLEVLDKYIDNPPLWDQRTEMVGGLDLSLGGDETVLVVRKGNEVKSIDGTRIRNATLLESFLDKLFSAKGLTKKDPIFTDIGGLGKPIFDTLTSWGWNLIPILNNSPALGYDKNLYGNRGTELWFEVANWYAKGYIRPLKDKLWREQVGSRKYIRPDNEKFKMQPKAQFKKDKDKKALANSAEWESPDRADAWVLAFANFEPGEVVNKREEAQKKNGCVLKRVTQDKLLQVMHEQKFAGYKLPEGLEAKFQRRTQNSLIAMQIAEYNKNRN